VVPYLYVAPAPLPLLLFVYLPLLRTVELSLFDWNLVSPNRTFVGLGKYPEVLGSRDFWTALVNTGRYIVALVFVDVALVLGAALLVLSVRGRAQQVYRSLIFLPTLVSMAVAAVVWLWVLNPIHGVLNKVLSLVGVQGPSWLSDPAFALWAVAAVAAWKYFGYNLLFTLAGLVGIPQEYTEAAKLDGAGRWALFRHVVWPLLTPTTLYVFVTTVVLASQIVFTPINVLTQGGPNKASTNLVYLIYEYGLRFFNVGYASAVAVLVFVAFLAFTYVQVRLLEQGVHYDD
jgi:sn-glycerol 3-phosphate transport system permease protein